MRIIIPRPHTYVFLGDHYKYKSGVASGTPAGCVLGDGTVVQIPGIYILSPSGQVEANVALASKDAHQELLKALVAQIELQDGK